MFEYFNTLTNLLNNATDFQNCITENISVTYDDVKQHFIVKKNDETICEIDPKDMTFFDVINFVIDMLNGKTTNESTNKNSEKEKIDKEISKETPIEKEKLDQGPVMEKVIDFTADTLEEEPLPTDIHKHIEKDIDNLVMEPLKSDSSTIAEKFLSKYNNYKRHNAQILAKQIISDVTDFVDDKDLKSGVKAQVLTYNNECDGIRLDYFYNGLVDICTEFISPKKLDAVKIIGDLFSHVDTTELKNAITNATGFPAVACTFYTTEDHKNGQEFLKVLFLKSSELYAQYDSRPKSLNS